MPSTIPAIFFPLAISLSLHSAEGPAESEQLVLAAHNCLTATARQWDAHSWGFVYEWEGCLEEKLFQKIQFAKKQAIKSFMAKSGYYKYDKRSDTYSWARKRIKDRDIIPICEHIREVLSSNNK